MEIDVHTVTRRRRLSEEGAVLLAEDEQPGTVPHLTTNKRCVSTSRRMEVAIVTTAPMLTSIPLLRRRVRTSPKPKPRQRQRQSPKRKGRRKQRASQRLQLQRSECAEHGILSLQPYARKHMQKANVHPSTVTQIRIVPQMMSGMERLGRPNLTEGGQTGYVRCRCDLPIITTEEIIQRTWWRDCKGQCEEARRERESSK